MVKVVALIVYWFGVISAVGGVVMFVQGMNDQAIFQAFDSVPFLVIPGLMLMAFGMLLHRVDDIATHLEAGRDE